MGYYLLVIGSVIFALGLWAGPLAAALLGGGCLYGGVQIVFFNA